MANEPKAMQEIHEIREAIYEDTKDMTPDERAARTRKDAQKLITKYGLKVKRPKSNQNEKAV